MKSVYLDDDILPISKSLVRVMNTDLLQLSIFLLLSIVVTSLLSLISCTVSTFSSNSTPEDFCHVNDFNNSQTLFHPLHLTNIEDMTEKEFFSHLEWGRPFVVHGVTKGWRANQKWNAEYFRHVFSNFELFSSTFATTVSPVFESAPQEDVYFGIFLNDVKLSGLLAEDYNYPSFVPTQLKMQGKISTHKL